MVENEFIAEYPSSISVNETQTNVAIAHAKKIKAWAESVIK